MKAADAKLQKVLTPEQWTNWEAYRKQEVQKRKEKKAEKSKTGAMNTLPANQEEDFY